MQRRTAHWFIVDVAVLAAAFSGGVHLGLTSEHFKESTWLGAAFAADGVAFLLLGAALTARRSEFLWRLTGALSVATAVAYTASRTIGLPGHHPEAIDGLGLLTTGVEFLLACVALSALQMPARSRRRSKPALTPLRFSR